MSERKQTIIHLFVAAALLLIVSVYRQVSLHYWPGDRYRPIIVYATYLILLFGWQYSIRTKILQKNMRIHLTAQNIVGILYLTVRFIQDAYLYSNIPIMRFTGYFIIILVVLVPLFGLYATFYLGMGENYRMSRKWYLLLIPASVLIITALTDDFHHFVYYIVPKEPQPNLFFHPYIGIFLVYLWALGIICYQINVIKTRSGSHLSKSFIKRMIPIYEPLLLLLFSIPYIATAYIVQFELVEYSAGLIFIVVLCWKLYILMGLIPVNTRYDEVFRRSTIAMQILSLDGRSIAKSENAENIDQSLLSTLIKDGYFSKDHTVLQLYKTPEEYVIWQNDLTAINQTIQELRDINAELGQNQELLKKGIQIQSEKASIQVRNEVYDHLAEQVSDQLVLLTKLVDSEPDPTDDNKWGQICLVGTYIKRFCNLQLIYQEDHCIPNRDLQISLNDMFVCMEKIGILASLDFSPKEDLDPILILHIMKALEEILEQSNFMLRTLHIHIGEIISYEVSGENLTWKPYDMDDDYRIEVTHDVDFYRLQLVLKSEVKSP